MKKDEHPHVVFDSNKLEHGSVAEHVFSPNGKFCAFTISEEDSLRVIVIDVETGETLGNSLRLFSFKKIAWSGDSEGFFIYVSVLLIIYICCILLNSGENLFSFCVTQYDPKGKKRRNLFYHYLDEHKHDKLIAIIRKAEAHTLSFEVSSDYKYVILRGSRMISIANIESLEEKIKFNIIFEIFKDALYVSYKEMYMKIPLLILNSSFIQGIRWQ